MCNASHFLLSKPRDWRPSIRSLSFEVLGSDGSRSLEEPFSEEAFYALSSLYRDKAPGLNGFTMTFWQSC
ncbi:hypothetical protein CK203_036049 [Vitis vinifera]|uniref:Uncharacterized protein n=1 Tax=Vitis vinifera TaxID=29760 RepID=A0A438HQY0_VITVI|nr:hypothetical protein CK203_036049 [Vitis vinifera]